MDQYLYHLEGFGYIVFGIILIRIAFFNSKEGSRYENYKDEVSHTISQNIEKDSKLVLVYPLAKSRYLKEGVCATFLLLIIWSCIVVYPAVTIIRSGEKITASDLEFICFIGFIVLVCTLLCLWWLYHSWRGHRLTANSESYCICISKEELAVGVALLEGRSILKMIGNDKVALTMPWSLIEQVKVLDHGKGGGLPQILFAIKTSEGNSCKYYAISRAYIGNRESELLKEIQAHLSFPIQGI